MFRHLCLPALAWLLTAAAHGQFAEVEAKYLANKPTYVGVLHLADGSWSPGESGDPLIGTTIYNNDGYQPYFGGLAKGYESGDYGRLPSPDSPPPEVGSAWRYKITGFEFSYATSEPNGAVE